MKPVERLHASYIVRRRAGVIGRHLGQLLPTKTRLLDVGSGDGLIASLLFTRRPDLEIEGIDVLVRERTHIPMREFDGRRIPYEDGEFDAVLLVDVLHHAEDPAALLAEARRVARAYLIVKDHRLSGILARPTLRFMDTVGNARHRVNLPHNYWTDAQWRSCFDSLNLQLVERRVKLGIYPRPLGWVFDRSLHFMALLEVVDGDGVDGRP